MPNEVTEETPEDAALLAQMEAEEQAEVEAPTEPTDPAVTLPSHFNQPVPQDPEPTVMIVMVAHVPTSIGVKGEPVEVPSSQAARLIQRGMAVPAEE